uniref:NADH pyrophosphatase-like N-terminal domain-containing protein n=1 Tax=Salarias fasciatus TaxID=181472 RepID=A0A672G8G7_SALFA
MFRPVWLLLSTAKHPAVRRGYSSEYVSRMRHLNRLKEDDEACAAALQKGCVFLFHRLSPLLQQTGKTTFRPAALTCSDVQSALQRLGADQSLLDDSVLIGCSEHNQAQFCLDVGELDQAAVEAECRGVFMDLRKSFFLLDGTAAPLVAKVSNRRRTLMRSEGLTSDLCSDFRARL